MTDRPAFDLSQLAAELQTATARTAELMARMAKEPESPVLQDALQELNTEMEELRVAEEELRVQAEQLADAAESIARERSRYQTLFEFAPDAYLETTDHGVITGANRAAGRLLGVEPARLAGKTIFTFVVLTRRSELRTALRHVLAGGRHELRTDVEPRDGDPFPAVVTGEAGVAEDGQPVVRWILRDISESLIVAERMAALEVEVELLNRLSALSTVLVSERPPQEALHDLVQLAAELLPGATASVSLARDGKRETPAASDPVAVTLDDAQYELDEGPCVDALASGEPQLMTAETAGRWPRFFRAAEERGVAAVLARPLSTHTGVIGALNLYSPDAHAFGPQTDHRLELLAAQGAVVITNGRLYASAALLAEQLNQALQSRPMIEQAKGILMAREGCDEDRAFDMLRRASQRTNRKLRDIARQVIEAAAADPPPH